MWTSHMNLIAYYLTLLIFFSYIPIIYFLGNSRYKNEINCHFKMCYYYTVITDNRSNAGIYILVHK